VVGGDVGEDLDRGGRLNSEFTLDGGEVVAKKVDDLGGGRDGERTHLWLEYQARRESNPGERLSLNASHRSAAV